jgi:hypothetical protein
METKMTLPHLCERIVAIVDRMRELADTEDWTNFWLLDKERDDLCQVLQNSQYSPGEFRACREGLEQLLEKNSALQSEVVALKQQYQSDLSARRQQRQVANLYAKQGAQRGQIAQR